PLPLRTSACSCSRSCALNRTTYFFTAMSFPAMIPSAARIAARANHLILSNWLKLATRAPIDFDRKRLRSREVKETRKVMDLDQRIAELTQRMLRRKFYAVLSQPSSAPEKLKPLLPAHLEYMIGLEKRGLLFASGPLTDGVGPPSGAGLTILRAASAE